MKTITNKKQSGGGKFNPGKISYSLRAAFTFSHKDLENALARHLKCDWGNADAESQQWNEFALENDEEIRSCYLIQKTGIIEIVTAADRITTEVRSVFDR